MTDDRRTEKKNAKKITGASPLKMKTKTLALAAVLALALTACGEAAKAPDTAVSAPPAPAVGTEAPAPERTAAGTLLLGGRETAVYLDVSDTEIAFWDSASGGRVLLSAKYPQPLAGADAALESCDYTDLDGDGNSELTAEFVFPDGGTASLTWFYAGGALIYNEEFSRLPGETGAQGDEG